MIKNDQKIKKTQAGLRCNNNLYLADWWCGLDREVCGCEAVLRAIENFQAAL
jgi:hypothetical protein